MAIDSRFITSVDLVEYFVDKTTGLPLSGGKLKFYKDNARTVPKLVYQLTGAPPNYTYTALSDELTLSSVGTPIDTAGNNIALYYFPYDEFGNVELYYITVTDYLGVEQCVREAWPNISGDENPALNKTNIANELTNPQFAQILFNPLLTPTITIPGAGTYNIRIAAGWNLNVTATGATTVQLTRNAIAGSTAYPFNPPYTLTVTPGANITALSLSQRLNNNPSIWSPQPGGADGYLATSILLAPLSSVTIYYAPSNGAQQTLLTANNLTGIYAESNNTVQLTPASNADSSAVGYVDIIISLPVSNAVTLSNIQVVGLETNLQGVVYDQTSVNRQYDLMFNYYNSLLQYKPIRSYLVGWDFALNPTQALGPTLAASGAGANTSRYVWDQTVVFQSANSGPAISRGTNGCLTITATNTTQFALVQYLEQSVARMILNGRNSVNLAAFTSLVGGLGGTISLWYTTDSSLPSCAANNSIVATLNAAGKPATFNGNWSEVPRSNLGDATFNIGASPNTTNFNDYGFSGWDLNGIAASNTATWFAIVVGFASLPAASTVNIDSISLVPGDIPTRPAPLTGGEALRMCQWYYRKTFAQGTIPATAVGVHTGELFFIANKAGAVLNTSGFFGWPTMVTIPTVTYFSPALNNNQAYDEVNATGCTNTAPVQTTADGTVINCTANALTAVGDFIGVHATMDSRLGK